MTTSYQQSHSPAVENSFSLSTSQQPQNFKESLQQSVSKNFGDFKVEEQINHGSFGHIFKLRQIKSNKFYAMKVLGRQKIGQQRKIKNQIKIHESLKNRFITQLINKFHDEEHFYLIMEYYPKGSLQNWLHMELAKTKNQNGSHNKKTSMHTSTLFPTPQQQNTIKKFSQQTAKGISYLHTQQSSHIIIHGDIKPSNVLLDEKNDIKICDFGLSTKVPISSKGAISDKPPHDHSNKPKKGTLHFLAPQCFISNQYGEKIDVWSWGVLLFYLMSGGQLPFANHSQSHDRLQHQPQTHSLKDITLMMSNEKYIKETCHRFSSQFSDWDDKLIHLFHKVFAFDPQKRYSIKDVLKHPYFTGEVLEERIEKQTDMIAKKSESPSLNHRGIRMNLYSTQPDFSFVNHNRTDKREQKQQKEQTQSNHHKKHRSTSATRLKQNKNHHLHNKKYQQNVPQQSHLQQRQQRSLTATANLSSADTTTGGIKKNFSTSKNLTTTNNNNNNREHLLEYANTKYLKNHTHGQKHTQPSIESKAKSKKSTLTPSYASSNATLRKPLPLNTENMVIKPLCDRNSITTIDHEGIRIVKFSEQQHQGSDDKKKENLNPNSNMQERSANSIKNTPKTEQKKTKEIKISPNGEAIYMKIGNEEKFYTLENLPEIYYTKYENCKKIVNSVKNHTPKLKFSRAYCHENIETNPRHKSKSQSQPKLIIKDIEVMYSGKITTEFSNGHKIELHEEDLLSLHSNAEFYNEKCSIKELITRLNDL